MAASNAFEDASSLAATIESFITAIAVVVGAVWAYFKFIKDRVYRPRLDVSMEAERLKLEGSSCLLCKVAVKNIGTSKIGLIQKGTGLGLSEGTLSASPYRSATWELSTVLPIFEEHAWIESGETIRHQALATLPAGEPRALLLEVRLVCQRRRSNIVVYGCSVAPPHPKLKGKPEGRKGVMDVDQTREQEEESARWEEMKDTPEAPQETEDARKTETWEERRVTEERQGPEDRNETEEWETEKADESGQAEEDESKSDEWEKKKEN